MTYTKYENRIVNKKYSSFSQLKGLLWKDHYEAILKEDFKAPIGAVIDLTDACNASCYWCNAQSFRSTDYLETNHVQDIIDLLASWDVESICYAGGGEPTLHPDFAEILEYSDSKGLQLEVSSNATRLNQKTIDALIKYGTFVSLSIDAGTAGTWRNLKGISGWKNLMNSLKELCSHPQADHLDKTYKILIVPDNQEELLEAGKLAKSLGFNNFYARPAGFGNIKNVEMRGSFDIETITKQFEDLDELEDENFSIYKSFGRTDSRFKRKHKFKECRATPLIALFCADGWVYPCIARREEEELKMCEHIDIKEFWNSKEHHDLIDSINLESCPLCPFSHYNEQIQAFDLDYMFRAFP